MKTRRPSRDRASTPSRLPCGRPRPQHLTHQPSEKARSLGESTARLNAYLEKQGLKRSEQRLQILEVLLDRGGHLSAQDLVRHVSARFPRVGSATVYRSLKILCEAGLLRETFSDSKGRAIYEIFEERGPHHDHMICRDCEAVFEFHSEEIEALQEVLLKKQGFSEDGHRHVVYVRCERLKRPSAGKPATK